MFFRVLGPLEARLDGGQVDLGGLLPRRLLSALLAAEGRPVGDGELAGVLWGVDAWTRPKNSLRVHVSRLRSAFGVGGRGLLERVGGGYRFRIEPDQTDAGCRVPELGRSR